MSAIDCDLRKDTTKYKPQCKYFVLRKKRYCRMTVKDGYDYCGEHEPKQENDDIKNDSRLRISCPFDNTHTCFANKLTKHLKKCNAKFDTTIPYLIKNINAGLLEEKLQTRQLINAPVKHILEVIQKVHKVYSDIIEKLVTEKVLFHKEVLKELQKDYGLIKRKHLLQTSSLLGHVHEANLLQTETCFIEFGAGKGQLSFWITKAVNNLPKTSFLLIDKASLRHKLDNKLDKEENNIHRLRADIADLVLHKVDAVSNYKNVVGITKHLCGEATDLALRCLMNSSSKLNITGIVMAFCCHHRCFWPSYTGKKFFEMNDLTREDFDVLCGLSSWATCGTGQSRTKRKNREDNNEKDHQYDEIQDKTLRDAEIGLSRKEREFVGKKCKLIIDYGRLHYLQEHFICKLYYYIQQEVSLENVCIVAVSRR